jgi:2'-5' RNA ligase superfamily
MHAIGSILDATSSRKIEALCDELDMRFKLEGINALPISHFSWQIAAHYDLRKAQLLLDELAKDVLPFSVRTVGIGMFTGTSPVLYLPLAKDRLLLEIHELLWQAFDGLSQELSPYHYPDSWMPHIALSHNYTSIEKLGDVVKALAFKTINWEYRIDNLALLKQSAGDAVELVYSTHFRSQ